MNIIKSLLAMSMAISLCIAQDINISGTVTDTGGTPIAGAVVSLEKANMATATASDGRFSIIGIIGINDQINQTIPHKLSVKVNNGFLYFTVAEKSPVEIITYTLHGKVISTIKKIMDIGTHSIALPRIGAGVYFYKVKTGGSEFVIKSHSIGRVSTGIAVSTQGASSTTLAKEERRYIPIDDVIKVTKAGYLNYRVIVTNSDTSDIEIKMIVCADTVVDIDGNVYQAVQIGSQVWTIENLRTTKYNDSTAITYIADDYEWTACTTTVTAAYCYSNNTTNADSIKKYGALYNWYAVATKKLAPTGWHVPSDSEWIVLEDYMVLNGFNWDGTTDTADTAANKIGKSLAAKTDWESWDLEGSVGNRISTNNSSGFSALPVGYRLQGGIFVYPNIQSPFWSSTQSVGTTAYSRCLQYDTVHFSKNYFAGKGFGNAVRLLRN